MRLSSGKLAGLLDYSIEEAVSVGLGPQQDAI